MRLPVTPCLPVVAALLALVAAGPAVRADESADSLIDAVKSGSIDRVRTLLRPGVNVNAPQGDGATALHWAAHRNDVAAADLLLRAGAAVNAANDLGATAIWLAGVNGSAVGLVLVAEANPVATGDGRCLGDANKFKGKVAVRLVDPHSQGRRNRGVLLGHRRW